MSQPGASTFVSQSRFSNLAANPPRRRPGWIARNRAALESAVTVTLTMSAPVLIALATLQTTGA